MTNTITTLAKIQRICRYTLVFSLFWHALMPKLIFRDATELTLVMAHGFDTITAQYLSTIGAVIELLLAVWLIIQARQRWPLYGYACLLLLLLLDTLMVAPQFAVSAFNVVTLNVALLCLVWVDQRVLAVLISSGELPINDLAMNRHEDRRQGWQALRGKSRTQVNAVLYRVVEKLSLRQIHLLAKTLMKDDWQRRQRDKAIKKSSSDHTEQP
jgi:hypothetical protein